MKKKAIWVFENITKTPDFYTSFKILMCISSVINWKKHNDTINLLYTDKITFDFLDRIGLLRLWDEVDCEILEKETPINKIAFWSSSKLRVLENQIEPVALIDWDFIAFTDIINLDKKTDLIYCYDEIGDGMYPSATDNYIKSLKRTPDYLKRSINNDAINVSYLCFNNFEFQKEYAEKSLECMCELSELGVNDKNIYVCYAEQKLIKQLALFKGIQHRPLVKNRFHALRNEWTDQEIENGIWPIGIMMLKFIHYGPIKSSFKKDGAEFKFLLNSIRNKVSSKAIECIINID